MDLLAQYSTDIKAQDGRDGTQQKLGKGAFAGSIAITPSAATSGVISEIEIQKELDAQIDKGILPSPNENTLFMVYLPPGLRVTYLGYISCNSFCAFHSHFTSASGRGVIFGVFPDYGTANCGRCPGETLVDAATIASSHEMAESITDPLVGTSGSVSFPMAWSTADNNEIGDLCVGNYTTLKGNDKIYKIQQEYDLSTNTCAPGPF